ncbi:MAG: hypothetical protein V4608_05915 [Bacteroidota bacterium]
MQLKNTKKIVEPNKFLKCTNKFFFLLFISFSCNTYGQDSLISDKNAIFGELFGNAQTLFSAHYERVFDSKKWNYIHYSSGIGVGIQGSQYDGNTFFSFPLEMNTFIGKKHNLEGGVGCTFFFGTSNLSDSRIPSGYKTNFNYSFCIRLGYRLIKNNGILIRLAPLLLVKKNPPLGNSYKLEPIFGISLGKCF